MPSKTISVTNGDGSTRTITIPDRSRFAGVRNISRAVNALPLTDSTTSIQVTVAGHANISGIYTGTTVAGATWGQQGGNGTITASSFNETDGYEYLLEDQSDSDPQYLLNNSAGFTDRPWKANLPNAVTITGIAGTETLTVNRTAPVITSDRKGESRPLLSKLVGGAAAAYSLRDLNDRAGNNKVVRVRRDTDNAEQDFTASGISSGALVDFATSGNGVFANTGYESFTNASASGFTASNTGSTGFAVSDILDGVSGDAVSVSFDIDITNGSPSISLRTVMDGGSTASNSVTYTSSGSKTATLTATKGYVGIGFTEGDAPSNFTISNFKVLGSGFVSKWYDQSGENFHMLQAESTKQPKIVENGTFLGSVKYDGVDDYLSSGSTAATMLDVHNQALSLFSVQTLVGSNDSTLGATNSGRGISFENTVVRVFITQNFHIVNHSADGSGFHLGTVIHTGDGSSDQIKTALNGVNIEEATQSSHDITSDGQPIFTTKYNTLGGNRVLTTNSNFFNGEIKEVVIWKTNQLANRPAIEANINNQYDIY